MSVETLQSQPVTTTKSYDIKRFRVSLDDRAVLGPDHQVLETTARNYLGLPQKLAGPLLSSPAFGDFLDKHQMTARQLPSSEVREHAHTFSESYIEIQPPMNTEQINELGRLVVNGTMLPELAPGKLDIDYEGVVFVDNRHKLNNHPVDTVGDLVASSLEYRR